MAWAFRTAADMTGVWYLAAARAIGRRLVADGATAEWLAERVRDWPAVDRFAPALIDLVSLRLEGGYNTLALVQRAANWSYLANHGAREYDTYVNVELPASVIPPIAALCRDERDVKNMRRDLDRARANGTADPGRETAFAAAAFAYDHVATSAPDAFTAAIERFSRAAPEDVVRAAMQVGARDALCDGIGSFGNQRYQVLTALRTSTQVREVLRLLFGAAADSAIATVDHALMRRHTAGTIVSGPAPWRLIPHAWDTPLSTAIVVMATARVDADLIALIPFTKTAQFSFAGRIEGPRHIFGHLRGAVSRARSRLSALPPAQQGLRILGHGLAADRLTRDGLIEALRARQAAGDQDATLADLLVDIMKVPSVALAVIQEAARCSGAANRAALAYRYRVEGHFDDVVLGLTRTLCPDAASSAQAAGMAEAGWGDVLARAGQYAYDNVLSELPDRFRPEVARFEQAAPSAPAGAVRDAMRAGARDRLHDWFAEPRRCGSDRDTDPRPKSNAGPLRLLFGEPYEAFDRRVGFEINRLKGAQVAGFGADPSTIRRSALSGGRFGLTGEMAQAIMTAAISPLGEEAIADIPIA